MGYAVRFLYTCVNKMDFELHVSPQSLTGQIKHEHVVYFCSIVSAKTIYTSVALVNTTIQWKNKQAILNLYSSLCHFSATFLQCYTS